MSNTRPPYAPEFRQQMVELIRLGRSPEELAREFEPSAQAIRNWVQTSRPEMKVFAADGADQSVEREELRHVCSRENSSQVKPRARDPCQKPRPGSLGRPARSRQGLRVRESQSGHVSRRHDVPAAGGLDQRVLRVAWPSSFGPR